MPNNKPPLPFNPSAAFTIGEATFTIHLDERTGRMRMSTNRPQMNVLAVIDLFHTQAQSLFRKYMQSVIASPGGQAPALTEYPDGETSGGTTGGEGA